MHILNIARHTPANGSVVSQPVAVRIRRKTHAQFDARVLECDTKYDNSLDFFLGRVEAPCGFLSCGHALERERSRGNDFA